jgi:NADH dehydrogenase FAD-containing subunit
MLGIRTSVDTQDLTQLRYYVSLCSLQCTAAGTNETKLAYYAGEQAPVVAANVKTAAAGTGTLKKYARHTKATAMIPLGPKNGAAEMMGNNLGAFLTKTLKGKSLMVPQQWATLKAGKVPQ